MASTALLDTFNAFREQCQVLEEWYYTYGFLFEDDDAEVREVMNQSAPAFFLELNNTLRIAIKLQMAGLTDAAGSPTRTGRRENLTVLNLNQMLVAENLLTTEMSSASAGIATYRKLIEEERNRLGAHLEKEVHLTGAVVGGHSRTEVHEFFANLQTYLDAVGNALGVWPLDISGSGGPGDVQDLIVTLRNGLRYVAEKRLQNHQ